MAKVKYAPAGDASSVTVKLAASDALVVASAETPFETADELVQAELEQSGLVVRVTGKGKEEG